ncbi:hypothetical protein OAV73_03225, partial [Flavobacteriaceae bacterium]|nr:hypothetical protein [Flavobacteriaceae bacterium]
APLANKDICLKFSIIDEINVLEYEEIFSVRTDNYGMVNLIIGTEVRTGGYASSFEDIQWSLLPKNLKIDLSTDIGCTTFTEISNSPFTAVPFALFAVNTVDNPLILENQREIALLRALIRATQIGAGLDADGGYTPEATTFFINSVTSLKEADIVLDNQVKINENNINANTGSITTNTSNIASNTININNNTTDIATKVDITDIVDDLVSGGTTVPLSAEQGKVLKALVDSSVNIIVEDVLTSSSTINALSANQGRVLKGQVDTKVAENAAITANTNTKITYDAKGLVTAGSAATTADINASTDRNYVTDAEAVIIGNTSGTNTGDQTAAEVVSTATGAIVATDVQSAIAELEAEKLALAGGTMTGDITMGANDIAGTGSVTATTFSGDLNGTINTATTATTQTAGNNSTLIATTAYADAASTDDQTAAEVVSTATGAIVATDVQSAIAELEAEKLALAGGTMSGDIDMGTNDISNIGNATINGTLDVTGDTSMAAISSDGVVTLSDNTTSTSSTTGALKVTGGVGIAENLNVGGAFDVTGAASMAAISSDGVVTLSNNTTSTSIATGALKVTGGVGIAENLNVGGTLNVTGAATAETPPASSNSTRIATTEFVAAGTAGTVTSISDHIHFSSNNNLAATSGTEYSATASIAKGRRTFDSSSATNTYNAGITLGVNSIVTITITQKAVFGVPPKIMQILVSNIDPSNNNFEITTYSIDGAASAPNSDFTFNFLIIK